MKLKSPKIVFTLLIGLLVLLSVCSLVMGAMPIPLSSLGIIVKSKIGIAIGDISINSGHEYVLTYLRLPRTILAIFTGASLSVAGAMMQGLFRNPLADPGLLGVSSGAALGASLVIVLGWSIPYLDVLTLPFAAFVGGCLATYVVMKLSLTGSRAVVANMLLAGIAINAIAGSFTGLLVYVSDDEQLRSLTFWSMGSLGGATYDNLPFVGLFAFVPVFIGMYMSKSINALLLGESEALLLGINVERLKRIVIVLVCIMVGTCVSLTGLIGFIGLVVPHLSRLILGPDNRLVIPSSILLGAILLLGADMVSRTIVAPAELPIGIVTSIIGGPFFLALLFRNRHLG